MRKIKKKWDNDPNNWSVISNEDKDGNREMFINQNPNTYWLKMKQISPYSNLALGTELKSIDDEITKKYGDKSQSIKSKQDLMQLFGMMTPSKNDILYTTGVERFSPELSNEMKGKIEEKSPHADKEFRKKIREKWERDHFDREGMYL